VVRALVSRAGNQGRIDVIYTYEPSTVPEPSSLFLVGTGFAAAGWALRRGQPAVVGADDPLCGRTLEVRAGAR
jgi:PEP-CTERM motif